MTPEEVALQSFDGICRFQLQRVTCMVPYNTYIKRIEAPAMHITSTEYLVLSSLLTSCNHIS
jgi:hypothetical protein